MLVPMAVRMVISVWITSFQISRFSIVGIYCFVIYYLFVRLFRVVWYKERSNYHSSPKLGEVAFRPEECVKMLALWRCENETFIDTRPPPAGNLRSPSHRALCSPRCGTDGYLIHPPTDLATPSNLEGELWLLLNLIDLRVEKNSNWVHKLAPRFKVQGLKFK